MRLAIYYSETDQIAPCQLQGSLEQRVTYVSIVCLSISSDHVQERWLFISRTFLGVAVKVTKQVISRKAHDYYVEIH